jgi:hypothetical protein
MPLIDDVYILSRTLLMAMADSEGKRLSETLGAEASPHELRIVQPSQTTNRIKS